MMAMDSRIFSIKIPIVDRKVPPNPKLESRFEIEIHFQVFASDSRNRTCRNLVLVDKSIREMIQRRLPVDKREGDEIIGFAFQTHVDFRWSVVSRVLRHWRVLQNSAFSWSAYLGLAKRLRRMAFRSSRLLIVMSGWNVLDAIWRIAFLH